MVIDFRPIYTDQKKSKFSRHLSANPAEVRQTLEAVQRNRDKNMEEEIKAEFNLSGFSLEDEEETLKKCLAFCINYKLKPSDLVSSWEVYYLNRQLDGSTVQNTEMDGFLHYLQNKKKEAIVKEETGLHIYSSKDVDIILDNVDGDVKDVVPGTPSNEYQNQYLEPFDLTPQTNGITISSGRAPKLVTPFGQRTQKFVVKFSMNDVPDKQLVRMEHGDENDEDDYIRKIQPGRRCSLKFYGSKPETGCRFMFDTIEDRFNALENRLKRHTAAFVSSGQYEEPVDPTISSQKKVFTVGMIRCDGEGHLNEKSTLLQSSIEHSGGQCVRLELQNLSKFSIFPGQVVGIEGHNPSGHCLIASKVVDSIPLSAAADVNLPPKKKQALDQEMQLSDLSCTQEELTVIIASGPFTTTDNLFFEPLVELLSYASKRLPQLLILMGPFVDSEHPEIRKGTADRTFDEMFHFEILRRLQDYVECAGSHARVILVPSIRDANHDLVFPQPAFDIHPSDLRHQVTSLRNPGLFEANQVKIGCCSIDIIKHLSREEISRNPNDGTPKDRIARLASHIIGQRSFYPLYPQSEDVPLDFSIAPEALDISIVPDILILPSDVKYFVKLLSLGGKGEGEEQVKCICVNPGRLVKGEGGGTFVELNYNGNPDKTIASIIGI